MGHFRIRMRITMTGLLWVMLLMGSNSSLTSIDLFMGVVFERDGRIM